MGCNSHLIGSIFKSGSYGAGEWHRGDEVLTLARGSSGNLATQGWDRCREVSVLGVMFPAVGGRIDAPTNSLIYKQSASCARGVGRARC